MLSQHSPLTFHVISPNLMALPPVYWWSSNVRLQPGPPLWILPHVFNFLLNISTRMSNRHLNLNMSKMGLLMHRPCWLFPQFSPSWLMDRNPGINQDLFLSPHTPCPIHQQILLTLTSECGIWLTLSLSLLSPKSKPPSLFTLTTDFHVFRSYLLRFIFNTAARVIH